MIRRAALVAVVLLMLSNATVSAAQRSVGVFDFGFDPTAEKVVIGDTVVWHNTGQFEHTSTSNITGLWSVSVHVGGSTSNAVGFQHAGAFAYHCAFHPTQMKGTIKAKMTASPSSGTTSTTFIIRVASVTAANGWTEDIQMHRNTAGFSPWKSITTTSASFKPTQAGTYYFRSRYRHTSDGVATGWSPAVSVSVL